MKERDRKILEALETGNDQKSLSLLYRHSLPKVCDHIKKNNGSLEEAKDIFQDAVLILFDRVRAGKFRKEHDVDAFLFTVAKNLWINRVKKKSKYVSSDMLPEVVDHDEQEMLKRLQDTNRNETIGQLMQSIGEKCRKLLTLATFEHMKLSDVADVMGIENEGAVKSNLYRCRQKMMRLVKENPQYIEKLGY